MIIYSKYNLHRKDKFQLVTFIEKEGDVIYSSKNAKNKEAKPFLMSFFEKYEYLKNSNFSFSLVEPKKDNDNKINFEYKKGETLNNLLFDFIQKSNKDSFIGLLGSYIKLIRKSGIKNENLNIEFEEIFGSGHDLKFDCVQVGCLDLNFDNIIFDYSSGEFCLIDYEWTFEFPVPYKYVLFRALTTFYDNYFYYNLNDNFISLSKLYDIFEITLQERDIFVNFEYNFQKYVRNTKYISQEEYKKSYLNLESSSSALDNSECLRSQVTQQINKELQQSHLKLQKVTDNLNLRDEELQKIRWEINVIKSSKFWKLRDWYLKFKFLLFSPRKFFKKYFQKAKYFGNLFFVEAKVGGIRGISKIVFNYVFPKISTSSPNDIGVIDKSMVTPLSEINKILLKEETKKFVLNEAVDVIIPVYNGIEFLPKLFESIFKNTTTLYRLIIIDDCSSDRSVIPFLKKIKKNNSKIEIVLIKNKNNLGFVRSVNKAVKYTKNHFVLLNTDVEVPYGWLERLMYPIFSDTKVASTTPFTNSGTICSFPETLKDNNIFEGLTVDKVDYYFSKLVFDKYPSVPTGVGFCMGCNKDVVAKVGMFDAESFGKGYGEENDWCQRVISEGYKNVIVPNLFVYHKHGGSFSTDEKKRLIDENSKKLLYRYPEYDRDIQKFIANDPLKKIREAMILRISIHENNRKPIVFFDHELGGGANYFRQKYINEVTESGGSVILVTYCINTKEYHVSFYYKKYFELFYSSDLNDVFKFINIIPISKIGISELVSYDDPLAILSFVQSLKMEKNIKLSIFVHDYFSICPKVFLLNNLREYCGVENINNCQKCLDESKTDLFIKEKNSKKWRNAWFNFISVSDELICFSSSSKEILMRAYPKLDEKNILVRPHSVDYIKSVIIRNKKSNNQLTIGILGGISYIKGSEIIKKMLDIIELEKINVKVVIIGEFAENVKNRNLVVTGKYNRNDIVDKVVENKIDVFFVPSIIPETFSYTAEEIMKMNFPLAVFNLGAPVERVVKYEKGVVINKIDAKIALDEIIKLSKKYENI